MPPRTARELRDRLTLLGFQAGWALLPRLPERLVDAAFRAAADRSWRRRGPGVRRLEGNLARVLGPDAPPERLRALSRAGVRAYARYWSQVFALPTWTPAQIVERAVLHDEHLLWDAAGLRRGVVLALPHMGNWDHAGAWIAHHGLAFSTVAERLEPAEVFDRFVAYRESLGIEVLPLGDDASAVLALRRRLGQGRTVALLADRDLTGTGVPVQLFGEPARLPGGPAALALLSGAPLVPVSLWSDADGRSHFRLHPPVDVPPAAGARRADRVAAMTRDLARVFERALAEHPGDWHMLQPVWTSDLPARRRERTGPAAADAPVGEG